ncbi:MAG: OmpA family protein [Myxococcales bacterium]|nr:OmpA family protein [Myxococcales bacterium]
MRAGLWMVVAAGCVSPAKYTELENAYNGAIEERDAAATERDAAEAQVQQMKERNRRRLQRFATAYETMLTVQQKGLAKVAIEDGRAVLQLESDVLFSSGSARLTKEGEKAVTALATILADGTDGAFQVEGHTDDEAINSREFPSNWHLGADRAIVVVQAMVDAGMPAERVSAASYAEHAPVAANESDDDRATNRRIEVVAMPDLTELLPYRRMLKQLEQRQADAERSAP